MIVKFFDYPKLYKEHESDFKLIFDKTLKKGSFILQKELSDFERNLSNYLNAKDVVGVADGTNALIICLMAMGVSTGDEVLIPSHTYIATASAVKFVGAKPILCECDENSSMSYEDVLKKINQRTKVLLPVNLNGKVSNMDLFVKLKKKYKNLLILEDSAQGLGSKLNGKHAGTFGDMGTLSFYPAKTLGCFGDGGAIIVNNRKYIKKIRMLRDHGRNNNGSVEIWGNNSRLDNVQAAILDFKLKHLDNYIKKRQIIASIYDKLNDLEEVRIPDQSDNKFFNAYQNYEALFEDRDNLQKFLKKNDVGTLVQWAGSPIHHFKKLGLSHFKLPKTDLFFKKCLMLPMNTLITEAHANYVVNKIFNFYKKK